VLRSNSSTEITGKFDFIIDQGISVGTNSNVEILIDNTDVKTSVLRGTIQGEPLEIRYNSVSTGTDAVAIHIDTDNDRIGIFKRNPTVELDILGNVDITGDLKIRGDFQIEGTTPETDVKVYNKRIELAVQTTATDVGADEGGIVVQGATSKTWLYNNATLVKGWESNVNINLATTASSYKINGVNVIEWEGASDYRLSGAVRSAPGLQNLPPLNVLTITNAVI
jgi:hypothetical protein